MKKIMPNDKCPCMSGMKYKFCCLKRKEFINGLKEITGGDYIDTNYVLSNVTQNSLMMRRYIDNILPLINMRIIFSVNSTLNANMRSMGIKDERIGIIIIKQIPIDEKDYFDLAHELGHLFTASRGYPMIQLSSKVDHSIGTVFSNTIMDPIINKMLYDYGFDFIAYLKKGFSIQIPMLKDFPEEKNLNLIQRHFIKCIIIEKELEWEIIDESVLNNKFKKIYTDKYPVLYQAALDFVSYAKKNGMDTPDKVRTLFNKLRSDNKMEQFIDIL